ncbi:hypothetical protein ABEB36_012614 [Hypothenemus hampei]|uniref:Uncharacterized protein n=1 Tax=Hypothenemus hampei TaxID=57062 RepID=A0ABD1EC28_HYPHA
MKHFKVSISSLLLGIFGSSICFMGCGIIVNIELFYSIINSNSSLVIAFIFGLDTIGHASQKHEDQLFPFPCTYMLRHQYRFSNTAESGYPELSAITNDKFEAKRKFRQILSIGEISLLPAVTKKKKSA